MNRPILLRYMPIFVDLNFIKLSFVGRYKGRVQDFARIEC